MFSRYVEIRPGSSGRRTLIVPWTAVVRGPRDEPGRVEILGTDGGRRLLVPWYAVRRPSREEATRVLRAALGGAAGPALAELVRRPGLDLRDEDQLLDAAVALLLDGSHVLVELAPEDTAPGRYHPLDAPRAVIPAPPPRGELRHGTRLRVRVVLDDAAALAGASVTLTAPDGQTAERSTGGGGDARLDDVATDGTGRAVVRPGKVPRTYPDPATLLFAEHVFDFPFGATVAADVVTGEVQTILLRRPDVERVDTSDLAFAPGSALLVPLAPPLAPVQSLATALARLQRGPPCRLLIVGHASPDGGAAANDALALRRAECARHLLLGERDAWVDLATQHGSPADVQRLLRYLAVAHEWPTEPARVDGVVDAAVQAAVARFQEHYNAIFAGDLDVDGIIGEQTLGALFDVQQEELRLQLEALAVPEAAPRWFTAKGVASAGGRVLGHPAIAGSWSAEGQRRVDLLLLPEDLTWRESHGLELLYDVARLRLLPISARSPGPCDLIIQVVDHYSRVLANEPYRVTTDEETREGVSDDQGLVVERALRGQFPRLECGEAVVVIDDRYQQMTRQRYERTAALAAADDDDDDDVVDRDAPLPAADDDEPDDDGPDDDGPDDADEEQEG